MLSCLKVVRNFKHRRSYTRFFRSPSAEWPSIHSGVYRVSLKCKVSSFYSIDAPFESLFSLVP
jgi:hypothetical protein